MKRELTYLIEKDDCETVGEFLRRQGFSRHLLIQIRKSGQKIVRNGEQTRLSAELRAGDRVEVTIAEPVSSDHIVPVKLPLEIVYEDEDILVVNKPADMPVHPSIHNYENTLANAIAYYYQAQGEEFVYRCMNRLDRDTTGLLVVAKHMLSAAILSEQIKKREIHREYLAIAAGLAPEAGVVDAPIARKEASVIERCVDFEKGERAVTHFWRLNYQNGYSLLRLKLETGRTHQIRVHMKYLGHPLAGDFLYAPDDRLLAHQALHSWKLSFVHPIRKERMEFVQAPPWDFDALTSD